MRLIDTVTSANLFQEALNSERKRAHLLLHSSHQDKVQRLIIALVQGSFVEPHFHELSHQWEMFVVTEGSIKVDVYDQEGAVLKSFKAGPAEGISLVEFAPGDIHSVECLSAKALMVEIKEGPFDPLYAKKFPHWSQGI